MLQLPARWEAPQESCASRPRVGSAPVSGREVPAWWGRSARGSATWLALDYVAFDRRFERARPRPRGANRARLGCDSLSGASRSRFAHFRGHRVGVEHMAASRALEGRCIVGQDPLVNSIPGVATGALNFDHSPASHPAQKIIIRQGVAHLRSVRAMRIALLTRRFDSAGGGTERDLIVTANCLRAAGHQITIFADEIRGATGDWEVRRVGGRSAARTRAVPAAIRVDRRARGAPRWLRPGAELRAMRRRGRDPLRRRRACQLSPRGAKVARRARRDCDASQPVSSSADAGRAPGLPQSRPEARDRGVKFRSRRSDS